MAVEIERKFLVKNDSWKAAEPVYFCQGYLNTDHRSTVRVRIGGVQGFLTVKGPTENATRSEFEYPIPLEDARGIMDLCKRPLIEKKRRLIEYHGMTWEVDEFLGDNFGLVIAEIELSSIEQSISIPDWVGEEVTHDPRYYNSNLVKNPFCTW